MGTDLIPVALFLRVPRPGATKTRLIPALGAAGAADLHRAFVRDTVRACRAAGPLEPTAWIAGDPRDNALTALIEGMPSEAQPSGDLGERMAFALARMTASRGRGLIVGTDAPSLPSSHLRRACRALDRADLVLGPSADGGYYLIGVRGRPPLEALFEGVRWSSRHALVDTLDRAQRLDLTAELLPPWYDVDTPEDLRLLRLHLALRPAAAPSTATTLGL